MRGNSRMQFYQLVVLNVQYNGLCTEVSLRKFDLQIKQYEVEQRPGLVSIPSLGGVVTNVERSIAGRQICLEATCRIY